ncbi:unnamed protein product [Somion occarium]|uniref:PARP-type domain-containing protein n=1 Tax=Somion occarium TaxID=3059160 RepID=A0ABP1DNJ4_9APHY
MSDDEGGGRKGGYRLDYALNNRTGCKGASEYNFYPLFPEVLTTAFFRVSVGLIGPKPCHGTKLLKGEFRLGTLVDFRGNTSWAYRHWGCVTKKVLSNMKEVFEDPADLDGFDDLKEEDQERVRAAWEAGHVADEDIPDTARKPEGEEGEEEEEEEEEGGKKKKKAAKPAAKPADEKGVFKVEYASSGRSKCKVCKDMIGKNFFRLGDEVDFRGRKSLAWQHWGCTPSELISKLKRSYDEPSNIEGFEDIKDAEKDKIRAAWEAGEIPEADKGVGEPVETEKKKAAPRKKKAAAEEEEERPKKRARKAKKEEYEEEEEVEEEVEEKPKKKRAPAKKAAEKEKAPAKKRAAKKKAESEEESGEDFGEAIANVSNGEEDELSEEEEEVAPKKRKRAPASNAKASSSKAAAKPASKRSAKPPSSRGKKQVQASEEDED